MADYSASYGSSTALLIGINSYQDARFVPLGQAEADARAMADVLAADPYNFTVDLILGEQATRSSILQHLFRLRSSQPDDRIIIYFAGHGYTLVDNFGAETGYLAAADTIPEEDYTALELDEITGLRRQSKAKHITFIFDACFSGQALGLTRAASVTADKYLTRRAFQVISAGAGDQAVSDARSMTRLMIDLLSSDITNPQGLFTANDLGLYVQQRMAADSGQMQIPQFGQLQGSQGGDMVFRQSVGGLPRHVVEALESSSKYIRLGGVSELARLARSQQPEEAKTALQQLVRLTTTDDDAQVREAASAYVADMNQADPRITQTMRDIRKLLPESGVVPAVPASAVESRPASGGKAGSSLPVPLLAAIGGGVVVVGLIVGMLALNGAPASKTTPTPRVIAAATASPTPDFSGESEITTDLGQQNFGHGLTQIDCCGDPATADGITSFARIGGIEARLSILNSSARYIYFDIDPTFIYAKQTHVTVSVAYFDQGTFCFGLDYDSTDTKTALGGIFKNTDPVCLNDSKQWKVAVFDLPDAYFGNRLGGNADFRTSTDDNELYISRVVVTKL